MRTIIFTLLISTLFSFSAFGSGKNCSVITAKHIKGKRPTIELERCAIGVGGASYDLEAAPIQHYWLSGKLFSGAVLEGSTGYVYQTKWDLKNTRVPVAAGLPKKFNCSGVQSSDLQCMVCNCYFEARGQNFDEQVMVSRAVLSRVLSPAHPKSICGVVHQKNQFSWTIDIKGNRVKKWKKNQRFVMGESSKDLRYSDKQSFRSCVASSREALKYDNEFFASYYVSKKIKTPGWLHICQYRSRKNRTKISNKDNKIGKRDLAHNFYRVCEPRENICLKNANCKKTGA